MATSRRTRSRRTSRSSTNLWAKKPWPRSAAPPPSTGAATKHDRRARVSDPRVEAAIAQGAPRFTAQAVDYNDFVRTTARIQTWADWCTEWQRTAAEHEALALAAEARQSPLSAADAWIRAAMCHHFGKFVFFDDLDQLRSASMATAADFAHAAPLLDPPAEAERIPYAGTSLPGYLRRPHGVSRPPVVLLIAGLDCTKEGFHTFTSLF